MTEVLSKGFQQSRRRSCCFLTLSRLPAAMPSSLAFLARTFQPTECQQFRLSASTLAARRRPTPRVSVAVVLMFYYSLRLRIVRVRLSLRQIAAFRLAICHCLYCLSLAVVRPKRLAVRRGRFWLSVMLPAAFLDVFTLTTVLVETVPGFLNRFITVSPEEFPHSGMNSKLTSPQQLMNPRGVTTDHIMPPSSPSMIYSPSKSLRSGGGQSDLPSGSGFQQYRLRSSQLLHLATRPCLASSSVL